MKSTPFTQFHLALGAKMAEFAGYNMPISYTGINDEHKAVRTNAGIFDVSHMGEFIVKGEHALDLIQRHFGPCTELDRRYVGDITYIATWEGWAYLATVIDLASRRVVGWALADHMRTELVEDALSMAFSTRRPEKGVIFHSDRGCQYTSKDFADLARANGVVLSVGRKGECWDNAVAESFFATIKRELIYTRAWPTRAGLHRAVFEYIEGWYNTRRLHSALGYMSPAKYEALHRNADRQAA